MVVSIIANFETTSNISDYGDSMTEAKNSIVDDPVDELDSSKGWVAVGWAFVSGYMYFSGFFITLALFVPSYFLCIKSTTT